jgi:hypothetical protein
MVKPRTYRNIARGKYLAVAKIKLPRKTKFAEQSASNKISFVAT